MNVHIVGVSLGVCAGHYFGGCSWNR